MKSVIYVILHIFFFTLSNWQFDVLQLSSNKLIWIVFQETVHASDLSRNSSVDIATRLRAALPRNLRSITGSVTTFICSPERSDRLLVWPSILWSGYWDSMSPVVKRSGRETDCSPVSNSEIKNKRRLCHQSSMCFLGVERMGRPLPLPTS